MNIQRPPKAPATHHRTENKASPIGKSFQRSITKIEAKKNIFKEIKASPIGKFFQRNITNIKAKKNIFKKIVENYFFQQVKSIYQRFHKSRTQELVIPAPLKKVPLYECSGMMLKAACERDFGRMLSCLQHFESHLIEERSTSYGVDKMVKAFADSMEEAKKEPESYAVFKKQLAEAFESPHSPLYQLYMSLNQIIAVPVMMNPSQMAFVQNYQYLLGVACTIVLGDSEITKFSNIDPEIEQSAYYKKLLKNIRSKLQAKPNAK